MSEDIPEADRLPGAPHPRETERLYGQDAAEAAFLQAHASGRMHHAWLLTGRPGVGKATFAWHAARFLLATPVDEADGLFGAPPAPDSLDIDPEHPVARRLRALSEPGLFLLRRPADPKAKRLATVITVREARRLKTFLGLSAPDDRRRVVIVDAAEEMNTSAANALLKLLEEPPPRATFLLVSHRPSALLPTIRSRCRTLPLDPLGPDDLAQALHAAGAETVEGNSLPGLAALAGGSVGGAFRLIEGGGFAFYGALVELFSAAPGVNRQAALALASEASAERFDMLTGLVETFLGRLARAGALGPPVPEAVPGEAAALSRLCPDAAAARRWASKQQALSDRARRGAAVNLDPKTLLLDMLLAIDGEARTAPAGAPRSA